MTWALVPAAGSGRRFGGGVPKQYLQAAGKPLIAHALEALLAHPQVDGAVVALAAGDTLWPGRTTLHGKPVVACIGGGERADSVLAALQALPAEAGEQELLLVHDAARPNLCAEDITKLIDAAATHADGASTAKRTRCERSRRPCATADSCRCATRLSLRVSLQCASVFSTCESCAHEP